MALLSASRRARPRSQERREARTPGALRLADVTALLAVWLVCVLTEWDTTAKILLNAAAVALLCLKELAVHRYLLKRSPHFYP